MLGKKKNPKHILITELGKYSINIYKIYSLQIQKNAFDQEMI